MEFNCCLIHKWNKDGANFFCLNNLTADCNRVDTLNPNVGKENSIVIQMLRHTQIQKPG